MKELEPFIQLTKRTSLNYQRLEFPGNGIILDPPSSYHDCYWDKELENREGNEGKCFVSLNPYGYRCKHYLIPPDGEYAVAFGCSHTFGASLDEQYRYSNLVESTLGIPVFNVGLKGGSVDFCKNNLLQLILYLNFYNLRKPKFIIVQLPEFTRLWFGFNFAIGNWNNFSKKYLNKDEWLKDENIKKIEIKNLLHLEHINFLCKINDIKLIKFLMYGYDGPHLLREKTSTIHNFFNDSDPLDYAKDGDHPGIESNKIIHDYIIKQL